MIFVLPTDYQHTYLVSKGNEYFTTIVNRSEVLQRFSSRISSNDFYDVTLGGELVQTGEVHFMLTGNPGLLRTHAYDEYTGFGFRKSTLDTDFSESEMPASIYGTEGESLFIDSGSYEIEMRSYYSNTFPVAYSPSEIFTLSDSQTRISLNTYGEYASSNYFIRGDSYQISYSSQSILPIEFDDAIYLQLPDTITPRTEELAHRLADDALADVYEMYGLTLLDSGEVTTTRGITLSPEEVELLNTYTVAFAFNNFLETNYTYTKTPPRVSTGDFVDSFLFESQEGYCTSFAASMVVLLRIVDIPCRYVTGYNTPAWRSPAKEPLAITDYDKHAWVEVLSDTYSIIPLDPTPPAVELADEAEPSSDDSILGDIMEEDIEETTDSKEAASTEDSPLTKEDENETITENQEETDSDFFFNFSAVWIQHKKLFYVFSFILIFIIGILLIRYYHKKRIHSILNSNDPIKLYGLLLRLLKRYRIAKRQNETVREFFSRVQELPPLNVALRNLGNDFEIDSLITPIEQQLYSNQNPSPKDSEHLAKVTRFLYEHHRKLR